MARASRELAGRHHEAIAKQSARLFRERGLNGVSVAEVMAGAGLTHGGFYGHFALFYCTYLSNFHFSCCHSIQH